jgi:hypothetical protein
MGRAALRARVEVGGRSIDPVTCHSKSELLTCPPGPDGRLRFVTDDEGERARVAVHALSRRAAEAATVRAAATDLHDGQCQHRRLMVCGDLKDVPEAATTQILSGLSAEQDPERGWGRLEVRCWPTCHRSSA